MARRQAANLYQVYIDTMVLVDLADPAAARHKQAQTLVRLFQRHRRPQRGQALQLVTSAWAVAEAHGVLYKLGLSHSGVTPPTRGGKPRGLRDIIPPVVPALEAASRQLDILLTTLQTTTSFLLLNDASPDTTQVWQLVNRIGREAAIYPTDSVHLALALQTGCAMLVSDDGDFLDKMDYCYDTFIRPYREDAFSYITDLSPFYLGGVRQSTSVIPGRPQRTRPGAVAMLNSLGFRFR